MTFSTASRDILTIDFVRKTVSIEMLMMVSDNGQKFLENTDSEMILSVISRGWLKLYLLTLTFNRAYG